VRPFPPGQSGNPGGRPKDASLCLLARAHTQAAIKALVSIMNNLRSPAAARVSAACALLGRGYGKPPQAMEMDLHSEFEREVKIVVIAGKKEDE
jgi:hypothetical protein